MSPRQAKRPVGRSVEKMYLDVLISKITDFYLNNNLTETRVFLRQPPSPRQQRFQKRFRVFSPHIYIFGCSNLFMGMLLKIQVYYDACFFPIWPPVVVNIYYFLVHAVIDGLGGAIIIETLPIRKLSS